MSATNKNQRQRDLAKIHIGRKQLGMDDQTYRELLRSVAGVESAADLDAQGRGKVLAHLAKSGFKTSSKPGRGFAGKPDFKKLEGTGKLAMIRKIEAYLAEAKRPWSYAHGMAKRMFKVERVQWCGPGQLHRIISALEYDARRHGRHTG